MNTDNTHGTKVLFFSRTAIALKILAVKSCVTLLNARSKKFNKLQYFIINRKKEAVAMVTFIPYYLSKGIKILLKNLFKCKKYKSMFKK